MIARPPAIFLLLVVLAILDFGIVLARLQNSPLRKHSPSRCQRQRELDVPEVRPTAELPLGRAISGGTFNR